MLAEERDMLNRIHEYANQVMGDIDPQKTQISVQLEKLRPVMEEIARERNIALEDVFIQYMDLASQFAVEQDEKLQNMINE